MEAKPKLAIGPLFREGWKTFRRRPGLCIALFLIYSIFTGQGGGNNGPDNADLPLLLLLVLALVGLALFVCSGAIRGGYDLAMLRLHRGDDSVVFTDVFAGFRRLWRLLGALLLILLSVVGAGLAVLLVALGVAAASDAWSSPLLWGIFAIVWAGSFLTIFVSFWPSFLLIMEDDLRAVESLRHSLALTRGNRFRLLVLWVASALSLIPMLIAPALVLLLIPFGTFSISLASLALGAGVVVIGPTIQLAWIGAYRELRGERVAGDAG